MADALAQPEFGQHFGVIHFQDGGVMLWHYCGEGPFALTTPDGRRHHFEDSDRYGPVRLRADGDFSRLLPWGMKHPFWDLHAAWCRKGRRVAPDGVTCIIDREAA
jgi:hypothetical protein